MQRELHGLAKGREELMDGNQPTRKRRAPGFSSGYLVCR